MKKIYHLSSCNTCQRIIKELGEGEGFTLQDIKTEAITPEQLDEMKTMAGSYEALFSRRARKYREMGLNEKELAESDYQQLILEEYTFLKRPVIIINDEIFVGNSKKVVAAAKEKMNN
ncbi:MAG: arsenate reductase [Chitinophagales bacterium]|nr:arsenate reductase [Chitinophagales bacterium]